VCMPCSSGRAGVWMCVNVYVLLLFLLCVCVGPISGASMCTRCPVGTFSVRQGGDGPVACTNCTVGRFGSGTGQVRVCLLFSTCVFHFDCILCSRLRAWTVLRVSFRAWKAQRGASHARSDSSPPQRSPQGAPRANRGAFPQARASSRAICARRAPWRAISVCACVNACMCIVCVHYNILQMRRIRGLFDVLSGRSAASQREDCV